MASNGKWRLVWIVIMAFLVALAKYCSQAGHRGQETGYGREDVLALLTSA
jgi:hypothetical protein